MPRLALRVHHQALEELCCWLEHLQSQSTPTERSVLVFGSEVLPRAVPLFTELIGALGEHEERALSTTRRDPDRHASATPLWTGLGRYDYLSARIRQALGSEHRERQCIGPAIGAQVTCVGRGAATDGWQPEQGEYFSRKRTQFQARCKACDTLRWQARQLKLTRRGALIEHYRKLREQPTSATASSAQLERYRSLSIGALEELRADWWRCLEAAARRLAEIGAESHPERWFAIDVDRERVFSGDSPRVAAERGRAHSSETLFVVQRRPTR